MIKVSLNKVVIITVICLLSILLISRDIFYVSINKYIYLGVCTVGILLTNKKAFMQLMSFFFPLMCGLPGTYVLLVAVSRYILFEGVNRKTILYFLFVFIFEMIALLWYTAGLDANIIHQILALCVLFIMLHNHEGVDYYGCIRMYWLGTILVAAVIVCSTLMNAPANWLSLLAKGWFRFGSDALEGIQTMTLRLNANTLAYYCLVSTMFGLIMINREKGIKRFVVLAGTIFLILSGLLTVSRSWILITGGCLGLYLLSQIKNIRYIFASVAMVLLLGFAGTKLVEQMPELLTGITTRITDATMDGAGGRFENAASYLEAMSESIRVSLIGAGATYHNETLKMGVAPHNGTIQVLVSYGVIGSALFFYGILSPLQKREVSKSPLLYWLPFIGCVLFVQTLQFINPPYLIYPYILSVYAVFEGRSYHSCI
ncbi:MAG: hypothetical protein IJA75_08365 [Oscillospiraceae bacterium]|nr:hypothetical protein [Oscillospiraceae bacterium]